MQKRVFRFSKVTTYIYLLLLLVNFVLVVIYFQQTPVKQYKSLLILWFYMSIGFLLIGLSFFLYRTNILKSRQSQNLYLALSGLFVGLFIAEIFLRATHLGSTHSEDNFGNFITSEDYLQKTWYSVWSPNTKIHLSSPEFNYSRNTNSLGLSDKEWAKAKDSNEIRIITLGDSFTEGDGASYETCYPKVLEKLAQHNFPFIKINVMNAGHCGSDPWFEYKKLHDLLLVYRPDIIVYTNSGNDLYFDHLNYGGLERFVPDSTIRNIVPEHKWMGLYRISYVFRIIVALAFDNTMFGVADRERNQITAISDSKLLSTKFSQLARENNFKCFQVIRMELGDLQAGQYDYPAAELMSGTDTLPNFASFDLLAYFKDSLHINSSNANNYFWEQNGHHNAAGYEAMAKGIYSFVKPELIKRQRAILQKKDFIQL